jgi:Tol biopolymer transport system component
LANIMIANPDGSGLHALDLPYDVESFSTPVFSPDGKRLLISHVIRFLPNGDCCQPFRPVIVNADGSNPKLLMMPWAPLDNDCLAWTLDQTRLLCGIGGVGSGIFSVRASDGLDPVRLTTNRYARADNGSEDVPGDVSPDGTRFVFIRFRPGPVTADFHAQTAAWFVENLDGTGLRRITGWSVAKHEVASASWSPDGRLILGSNTAGQMFTVRPDGFGLTRIHPQIGPSWTIAFQPHWSPSGTRIVFGMFGKNVEGGLFTAHPDGTDVHRMTTQDAFDNAPTWGAG